MSVALDSKVVRRTFHELECDNHMQLWIAWTKIARTGKVIRGSLAQHAEREASCQVITPAKKYSDGIRISYS